MTTNFRGNRAVTAAETMSDEQRADLEASRPKAEEIATDKWTDEPDTTAARQRRSRLRLPFRS
jgi:hypothetical protein